MGEAQGNVFEPKFNRSVKVSCTDQRLSSHAGALLLREFDHQLGLTESLGEQLRDPRRQDRIRYQAVELIRERTYALAMGDKYQDDVDRLAHDPALKLSTWDRPGEAVLEERLASQPTQSRLIGWLAASQHNREVLRSSLFDWTHRHLRGTGCDATASNNDRRVRHATIDIDSFPVQVHGKQAGANYNGYYKDKVYHPMVASFSVAGDYDSARDGKRLGNGFIHCVLRQGSVHTANGIQRFVRNVVHKAKQAAWSFDIRLDAGYVAGAVLDELSFQNVHFCGRIRKNPALVRLAEPHLKRPPGRPPAEGYEKIIELGKYQAEGWAYKQRLILVIVDRPDPKTGQLDLMPRYFFLITNWSQAERSVAEDLKDPTLSVSAFRLRLEGALGVGAAWKCMLDALAEDKLPVEEVWFYGAELLRELGDVELQPTEDREAKSQVLSVFCERVHGELSSIGLDVETRPWVKRILSFYGED